MARLSNENNQINIDEMKKIILVLVMLTSVILVQSQVFVKNNVGEVINLNSKDNLSLIRLIGVTKGFTLNKIRLYIDYGQHSDLKDKDSYIVDSGGNKIEFESIIAIMNHIEDNGWEYLNDAYSFCGTGSNGAIQIAVYNYTFRKKQ